MSVRKRKWTTAKGQEKEAWVIDYTDGKGKRRLKTFDRKKDADTFAAASSVQIKEGTHVAESDSTTVAKAGALWIVGGENAGLERSTLDQYRQHLELHIVPFIGSVKLPSLNIPSVRAFEDRLRGEGRSPAMVKKIIGSLGSLIADAQERGLISRNPVRDMRGGRKGKEKRAERRQKGKLKVGIDIPTREDIKAIVEALQGRWRPLLITAIFTGMRASELRGLRWTDVDIEKREIRIHQRADRFNEIGRPKSEAGERTIPVPTLVINSLREWKLACPKGALGLVFPNGSGNVESLANIINRGLIAAQIDAGMTDKETGKAKYTGLHSLRHWYASWCINRQQDGGLGLPAKVVQERLGHSSILMTMDVYGHLFPRGDDGAEMEEAGAAILA